MNRIVLAATIAVVSYGTSFHSPGPYVTRVAPDRVQPRQRVVNQGFWNAGGSIQVIGPSLDDFLKGRNRTVSPSIESIDFDAGLKKDPAFQRLARDDRRRGFFRSIPNVWYGVRSDERGRIVPSISAAGDSRFYVLDPIDPKTPSGWRILAQRTRRVELGTTAPNAAILNGGVRVRIHRPADWSLSEIGLDTDAEYTVVFNDAWKSPYSSWSPLPVPGESQSIYEMVPVVFAMMTETTIEDVETGDRRTTTTPTGWVEAAGRFRRIDRS